MKLINTKGFEFNRTSNKKIKIKENQKKLIINNEEQKEIYIIHVDSKNSPIEGKKCDYLFFSINEDPYFYLELKGKDIKTAFEQIINTKKYFNTEKEKNVGIIITSNRPKFSTKIQKLQNKSKKYFRKIHIKNNNFEINI
ncbi:hypothetical protein X274_00175 [Marinitoga sp. 1155]|nr:hypothetical protein X274_00175 [Marinitoga sp. 1155]